MKMSSAYHPQTDGSSERTNKTVIQCIRFAVERDQKGWVQALPKVRFDIMNTLNASTGFTPFQLRFGKTPRILPPIIPNDGEGHEESSAREIVARMRPIQMEAQDNLLGAKVNQANQENQHRQLTFPFKIGDRVVLSTAHRRRAYKSGDQTRAAKFMPRFDGPYQITDTDEKHSTVTLALPKQAANFPVFHTSEIKPFIENSDSLFPTRALIPPDPVLIEGQQEFYVDKIVDERCRGRRKQYLVRWRGEGPEGDIWLPEEELEECEALDAWQLRNAPRPEPEGRKEEAEAERRPKLLIKIPPRAR